ncbi:Thioredoxin-1 [Porphyridium purpureum]|uniref:Thioredoxin n=1 Tax=Porphyridium purpureum TaxID=35688 RepID=A0A5J4Z2N9_PORPP|nr:Thioredoxin-1 [Porphyridium purpureum]|eukprot:POR5183..scf208_2
MGVIVVESEAQWEQLMAQSAEKLVMVDFFAVWCGPCKVIAPVIEAMSNEHTDVVFAKVDVDELSALAQKNGISAMPTFICFKNGKEVAQVRGANKPGIEDMVKKNKF